MNKVLSKSMKVLAIAFLTLVVANTAEARVLNVGSTGASVVDLQTFLINEGYPIPLIEDGLADMGYFGQQTKNAVLMYQESKGLPLTGSIDTSVFTKSNVLGAVVGPENYDRFFFNKGISQGGAVSTTSTVSAYTTAGSDFRGTPTMILWSPSVNTTVTLNATSTFEYVPKVGDIATVYLLNASTTAASAITFAAQNASVDLQFTEATGGDLVLNGLDWAKFTFIRQTANKVSIIFDEFTEAD